MDKLNLRRQCADPLNKHQQPKKIVKDLRAVSELIITKLPHYNLSKDHRLCKLCKEILNGMAISQNQSSESSRSEDENSAPDDLNQSTDHESPDSPIKEHELSYLNESLLAIGESPMKKDKLKTRDTYAEKKLEKATCSMKIKMETVKGKSIKIQENIPPEVMYYNEIMSQLKDKFKNENKRSEKVKILTVLPQSWSIRKTALEFETTKHIATVAKRVTKEKGILSEPNPKVGKLLDEQVIQRIYAFYLSEEVSRIMPGKKDCVSVVKDGQREQLQKQLLLCNLSECYQLFKEKYPADRVGFSKFAELRPKQCIIAGAAGTHSVCVCTTHQNMKLMCTGAKLYNLLEHIEDGAIKHPRDLLNLVMCSPSTNDCALGECNHCGNFGIIKDIIERVFDDNEIDSIQFKRWTQTDRSNLESLNIGVDEFIDFFIRQLKTYQRHEFITKKQSNYYKNVKQSLQHGVVLVVGDFAENYQFVLQDEIQSFHWNNQMVTIHPFIVYYSNGRIEDQMNIMHKSFVVISENNIHDTIAVHLYQKYLIDYIKKNIPAIQKIIYFSDGCAGQYKNRKNFINLCYHQEDFGISAEWNFFATSHGKGPCDGLGGTIKRLAAKASLQRPLKDQILTPYQLYQFVKENIKSIDCQYSTIEEYDNEEKFLEPRFAYTKTIAGTQQLHFIKPLSTNTVAVKYFSSSEKSRVETVCKSSYASSFNPLKRINGYATAVYDNVWWVILITKYLPSDEVEVSFLHPHGPNASFFYPERPDVLVISVFDIFNEVQPTTLTGRTYHLKEKEQENSSFSLSNHLKRTRSNKN